MAFNSAVANDQTVVDHVSGSGEHLAGAADSRRSGETTPLTLPGPARAKDNDQTVLDHVSGSGKHLAGPAHGSGSGETTPFTLPGPVHAHDQTVVDGDHLAVPGHGKGSGEPTRVTLPEQAPVLAPVCPTAGNGPDMAWLASTKTDRAVPGQAKTVRVRRRKLGRNPSIDDGMATELQKEVSQQPLRAEALKGLDGLTDLAFEHLQNFQKLICPARSIVPPCKLRIGTACTGSSADLMSMVALQRAMDTAYPGSNFSYEYIFNCEKIH